MKPSPDGARSQLAKTEHEAQALEASPPASPPLPPPLPRPRGRLLRQDLRFQGHRYWQGGQGRAR